MLLKIKIKLNNNETILRYIHDLVKPKFSMDERLHDIRTVAESIFAIEDVLHSGNEISEVEIPLHKNYTKLPSLIEQLLFFLFGKSIKIIEKSTNLQTLLSHSEIKLKNDITSLFSGGIDSFVGTMGAKNYFKTKVFGAFTLHTDQKISKLIRKLENGPFKKHEINIIPIESQSHKKYIRRSRGLLYILNSMLLGNRNMIISECGVTMYQPKFTVLDEVTFTTHPKVLNSCKDILNEIMQEKINLIKPAENLTKAEVCSNNEDIKNLLETFSCWRTMFCNRKKSHCGVCYSCVIRRLGMLVAGYDETGKYINDIFIKSNLDGRQINNAVCLLNFSLEFLDNPESLPWITKGIIFDYNKKKLFERFSLDNLVALLIFRNHKNLNDKIFNKKLDQAIDIVGKDKLENRISEVREKKFNMNFSSL